MKMFIGTKLVRMKPMNRQEYNDFRGWELSADENPTDDGYLVEYIDGGRANTKEYTGYVSWSPKDVADRNYRPINGLTFGLAIEAAKLGKKIARRGWNGKGMWVALIPALDLPQFDTPLNSQPYFVMWTALGQWQPGWLASQADMLAEDWEVFE